MSAYLILGKALSLVCSTVKRRKDGNKGERKGRKERQRREWKEIEIHRSFYEMGPSLGQYNYRRIKCMYRVNQTKTSIVLS